MPFTPPPSSPTPLLDASLYDALGDLTPKAQILAEARLTISFTAGKVVVEVAGAAGALARLTLTPGEFHEALRTIALTLRHTGGHVLSAADQTFWLDEMRGDGVLVRLAALWPPRDRQGATDQASLIAEANARLDQIAESLPPSDPIHGLIARDRAWITAPPEQRAP